VIISGVGALSSLSTLEKYLPFLKKLGTVEYSLLQGLLPVVAMVVLLALVPMVITKLSMGVEKRKRKSQVLSCVCSSFVEPGTVLCVFILGIL
jgi:hypothetical protein